MDFFANCRKVRNFVTGMPRIYRRWRDRDAVVNFEFTDEDLGNYMFYPKTRELYDSHSDNALKGSRLETEVYQEVNGICDKIEAFITNKSVIGALAEINDTEERKNAIGTFEVGAIRHASILLFIPKVLNPMTLGATTWFVRAVKFIAPYVVEKFPKIVKESIFDKERPATANAIKLYDELAKKHNAVRSDDKVETSKSMLDKLKKKYIGAHEVHDSKTRQLLEDKFDSMVEVIFKTRQNSINTKVAEMNLELESLREEMKSQHKAVRELEKRVDAVEKENMQLREENAELKQRLEGNDGRSGQHRSKSEQQSGEKNGSLETRIKLLEDLLLNMKLTNQIEGSTNTVGNIGTSMTLRLPQTL
ncbi:MAG: hypothetical protein LBI29_01520 [Rickettsiales bacterium]|jgi:hypothetical protein|nr:hypothetical protein [Rickettsiales bacterium]